MENFSFDNNKNDPSDERQEDEVGDFPVTPEELAQVEAVFKKAGMEIEAREKLGEVEQVFSAWYGEKSSKIKEKLANNGPEFEEVDSLLKQVSEDFILEIRGVGDKLPQIKGKLESFKDLLKIDPEIESAYHWVQASSPLAIASLLVRKLTGQLEREELLCLDLLNLAEHGGTTGSCGNQEIDISGLKLNIGSVISLSLYNDLNLDGYGAVLDHEIGHYISNQKAPKAKDFLRRASKDIDNYPLYLFAGFLLAIDETYAHILGQRRPHFASYASKVDPRIFEATYKILFRRTASLGEKELENYFIDLLNSTSDLWREDLDKDDVYEIFEKVLLAKKASSIS